ncbi:cytochrome P450 [Streptomyces sp. Je 1-4]|uniref:cytochrome P450 n=1 Tax=Streptomyces TaxID=1883 RepID=UPI0021DA09DB|nr:MULTISPECIES: cytochrome P450 [unclassified Streptomyces]UYB41457.1 cytochrome P450 [Streptomyces sp. Je 1-4]UZQ37693.1 cytochrome P450 [Streptomyces sp. Je 1-4] [Streptomyces sp. Je 1-4 4N24]UZQ45110.1 cytochrome P450 [Streptomyces sp. Je 1-4] [Streptomyces sp. Je 1-4 4N24_ara]
MTNTQPLKTQPTVRSCPFDPPGDYRTLREQEPVVPMTFPDGVTGWLVTRYEDVRTVLADPRFSTKGTLPRPGGVDEVPPPAPGMFLAMDAPEHTRFRRLLTGQFTVKRMRQLTPAVERIVAEQLDAMAAAKGPVDLVQAFALPIPSLVICELLGVPYADREEFQRNSATIIRLNPSPEEFRQAQTAMHGYLHQLVLAKREKPTGDLLSELVHSGELTDEELAGVGVLLLIAGHETTANMIALGAMCLLQHPEQLAALRADPSLMDNAVEELLRYLTIIQFGIRRRALEDLELNGRQIKAGSMVAVSLASGNRDTAHLADAPERLDVGRPHSPHLAFGHGIHQCLGQQLARVEMKAALSALLDRFPALRLAVPVEEVPMRDDMLVYGVHELPVTW